MIRKLAVVLTMYLLGSEVSIAGEQIDFGRDVLPILSENCFYCHGQDGSHREADLRLDQREAAIAGGAITPGDLAESSLWARISSDDPSTQMPPPRSNRKLDQRQREILAEWIKQGAEYRAHWSFVPATRPPVPAVAQQATVRNEIDHFIVERLEREGLAREGLAQSISADPEKLLRRVSLDLTGFPPSELELDSFLKDPSEASYREVVERLLNSPRFGERMAWDWLDAARYADTNGYQGDPTRPMWYWRDWVIKALNENMPFDRFTREQIAGDLLANPTVEQLIATGFHRNHMINGEGGRIAEESRIEYVQDRVETTGTVWMGLTLTCCRCHDHKYDPFSQKQYYELAAYFNSIDESGANDAGGLANPVQSIATSEQKALLDQYSATEQQRRRERDEVERKLIDRQADWEAQYLARQPSSPEWEVPTQMAFDSEQGTELVQDGDTIVARGVSPLSDTYEIRFATNASGVTAVRIECLPDPNLVNSGPGRADNGNFVLSEVEVVVAGKPVAWRSASAAYSQGGWMASGAIDGKRETGWAIASEFGKTHPLLLIADQAWMGSGDDQVTLRLRFDYGRQHTLGRFRIALTRRHPLDLVPAPEKVQQAFSKPVETRSDAEKGEIRKYFLGSQDEYVAANNAWEKSRNERDQLERSLPKTMVMRERATPRETFVLAKGAYNAPLDKVSHGVLENLLPAESNLVQNRLQLADWLLDPRHPLTARVAVNRYWQMLFGTGLVATSEDFGLQGEQPSHPELLDWLAVEFRESGWNVKELIRLIVTSHTYRQSSVVTPQALELDPKNRLLARGPRMRLPSWMLRDQALYISGLLVENVGGPPVKGYQPPGIWEDATFGQIRYEQDHGEALYRRSLYTFWRRIVAPPMFFDSANRQNCSVKSVNTNTPLHALVTLNDVTFAEASRAWAQRMLLVDEESTDTKRLQTMWRSATGRVALDHELAILEARLNKLRAYYSVHVDEAMGLIQVGESKANPKLDTGELAAWTCIASIVLNLDETLSKE